MEIRQFMRTCVTILFTSSLSFAYPTDKPAVTPDNFLNLEPQLAAIEYLRSNIDPAEKWDISVKEKPLKLDSGMIEYGGAENMFGVSNNIIQFGQEAKTCRLYFNYRFMRTPNFGRENLSKCQVNLHSTTDRTTFLAKVITEFSNINIPTTNPLRMINYNPPTIFNGLKIYNDKRSIIYDEKHNSQYSEHTSAMLSSNEIHKDQKELIMFDPYDQANKAQRESLIKNMRQILHSPRMPISIKKDILKGIRIFCLHELKSDITKIIKTLPEDASYVKKFNSLSQIYKNRESEIKDFNRGELESYEEYFKLLTIYREDHEQQLKAAARRSLESLHTIGNFQKIKQLIIQNAETDHLLYHAYRTDKAFFNKLSLFQLDHVKTAYQRRLLILKIKEASPELLLEYLNNTSAVNFVQCSALCADLIREKKPEWKNRLQIALSTYHHIVKDSGYWPLAGLEAIVPEDEPRYFDQAVVQKTIKQVEQDIDQFTSEFCPRENFIKRINNVKKRLSK